MQWKKGTELVDELYILEVQIQVRFCTYARIKVVFDFCASVMLCSRELIPSPKLPLLSLIAHTITYLIISIPPN